MAYTLQDSYTSSNNSYSFNGTSWGAQVFTAGSSYTVTKVELPMYCTPAKTGTITVSIRATSGGVPTGADLCSGTYDVSLLPTSNDGTVWQGITLGAGTALTNGTVYAIVTWSSTSGASTYWRENTGIVGGGHCRSLDSGSSWTAFTTIHTAFKTYSGSDVSYAELEATGGGTSGGSTDLGVTDDIAELEATGGGTGGGTAELTSAYPVTPPVTTHMVRRVIAIGSNYLYYEDI